MMGNGPLLSSSDRRARTAALRCCAARLLVCSQRVRRQAGRRIDRLVLVLRAGDAVRAAGGAGLVAGAAVRRRPERG